MKPSRYPELKKVDGKYVCRGCGGEVPKGRQTWCSGECYRTRCPRMVIFAVRERDKGICQICGVETLKRPPTFQRQEWNPVTKIVIPEESWEDFEKKLRDYRKRLRAEYDHIIPFSEGGKTILENIQTLCRACHIKVTSKWRREKSLKPTNQ